jgi:RNA 2',3'-cyclic 3'-phosphodiesterase
MSLLRVFIAIEIPIEIKKAIAAEIANLHNGAGRAVRWVTTENIHLTLKFLGEISPANVELLSQVLQTECDQHAPFDITVNGLGCFPNSHRPRIIWIGLNIPPELNRLQHKLETATARMGYTTEDKPFSPHLTIGRIREQATPAELNNIHSALEKLHVGSLGTFTPQSVHLFKSDLKPAGPVYTSLFSARLGNFEKDKI